jgi:C-5 cytosine-specific DNA methylase
VYGEPLTESKV